MAEDIETKDQIEEQDNLEKMEMPAMGMNYFLDFEELDALEEVEKERHRLMKRGEQFMKMLQSAQQLADIEKIRNGMGRMMRKAGYMKPMLMDEKAAPMKTEGGVSYPKSDFAYAPSDEVSTWKLRLAEGRPGNITRSQLGAAAAALSPGGFRGNRVELPSNAVGGVKQRIRKEYEKLGVDRADMPASVKDITDQNKEALKLVKNWYENEIEVDLSLLKSRGSFDLYKDGDQLRWLGIYSNNFRDNDNPPEIISKASHQRFVEMVDKGEAEYPELWYWHIPGTRYGIADFVAFDDSGFAIASGTIDKGMETIAKNIAELSNQAMSHGMPNIFIKRDETDPSIITEHITTEISVLPFDKAANKLTNFIMEDKGMSLPKDKAETLAALGFDVDAIQQGLEAKSQDAINSGIEHKETEQPEVNETVVEEIPETEAPAGEFVSRSELLEVIEQMAGTVKALTAEVTQLKEMQGAELEKQLSLTPPASLTAIWQSAIGAEETKVDGRTSLAKAMPEETKPENEDMPGIPTLIREFVRFNRHGLEQ